MSSHGTHTCHFCGNIYSAASSLYTHQKQHCRRRFKCTTCDREFPTLVQCNTHMSAHISRIGACSTEREPSMRRHGLAWNRLVHVDRPWYDDAEKLLGYGRIQQRINDRYMLLRGRRPTGIGNDPDLRRQATEEVLSSYRDRIHDIYRRSATDYVDHTTAVNGNIERFNVTLLERRDFLGQVKSALRDIFDIIRRQQPYKLAIAFGFLLYKTETDDFSTFFVVQHLSRDLSNGVVVNQMPNIWCVRNAADEDRVISDIRNTEFFDLVRDQFDTNYNFIIVRMTHMVVEVFPMDDCALQERVVIQGGSQFYGRGRSDEDEEDHARQFIHFEAEHSDDDDSDEEEDEGKPPSSESHDDIRRYISRLQHGPHQVLLSLEREVTRRVSFERLCFFAQLAWSHLRVTEPNASGSRLRDVTREYYELYRQQYNIMTDDMFRGVHIATIPYMEYLFQTRINIFEIRRVETDDSGQQHPYIQPLYVSSGSHVYNNSYPTVNLLFFDNHYYNIRDMKALNSPHGYTCPSCGQTFNSRKMSNIKRHMTHHCDKRRVRYKKGCVQPPENRWVEARRVFSMPDEMLSEESLWYTSEFVTFDFEARIDRVPVEEFSEMGDRDAYEDDGTRCTEQEYLDRRADDSCVLVNIPLSFALATNIPCSWLEHRDGIYVAYSCNKNPTSLIDEFVTVLGQIAVTRKRLMIERYQDVIEHIHQWFAEKGLTVEITDLEGTVAPTVLDDRDTSNNDAHRNMDTLRKEIHLLRKLRQFISVLPILGFNSSAYDIPLIKRWLFPRLLTYCGGDTSRIQFVKKSINRYASLYARAGDSGLSFLDVMHYLAPGFNLDQFIRSFASSESRDCLGDKSVFPYEYIDTFDRLSETALPPYEAFYSRLRNGNMLDLDYRWFKSEGGESTGRPAPATGEEVYERLQEQWTTHGWRTVGDYLRYYNIQDVGPFLEGVLAYSTQLRERGVDMVRDGISLPGLAKHILLSYVLARTLHYISSPYIYEEICRNEVGGQSIIFTRRNDDDHPFVKGYDANSLYLYCLGEGQFVGSPIIYTEKDGGFLCRADNESLQGSRRLYGRDSKEAERYLKYYDDYILQAMGISMTRQYAIRLTRYERATLTDRYATHEIPQQAVSYRIIVDGYYETTEIDGVGLDRRRRHVVEFDGCYWHGCSCRAGMHTNRRLRGGYMLNREQSAFMTQCRHDILRDRGFELHVMRECDWSNDPRRQIVLDNYLTDPLVIYRESPWLTHRGRILGSLEEGTVHGIVICDLSCHDEIRDNFQDFAPIIKHAIINYEDIGEYMQRECDRLGVVIKDRQAVIDSYCATNIALIDEYFMWLLSKGVRLDRLRVFIRYDKQPIFKEFVDEITRLRIEGDADPAGSSGVRALTAKLIGNSAFGSCITNKEKHRDISLYSFGDMPLSSIASLSSLLRYKRVSPALLEVEHRRRNVTYDQLRVIAKTIFDRAKLSVLKFYHDVLKDVLYPNSYQLLETDTDSIYIALQDDNFEDNVLYLRKYDRIKDDYLVSENAPFGVRQPNRYKLEYKGHMMVSLCSKSYCVYNETTRSSKYSCKGIQKANFQRLHEEQGEEGEVLSQTISHLYDRALSGDTAPRAINRGLKRYRGQMILHEQDKVLFNSVYVKRQVLADGVSTIPLEL